MKKTKCDKCENYISNNNYKKHVKSCDNSILKYKKTDCCVHCKLSWVTLNLNNPHEKANHSRWCDKNPKKHEYIKILSEKVRYHITDNSNKKRSEEIKKAWKRGAYKNLDFGKSFRGKKHTEKTKELLKEKALKSNHRRLRKGVVLYKNILLDSSWELELAKRLDELEIEWIRPEPLKWLDKNNVEHNYFPDFYLKKYDLYLDPKNPAAFENQKEKIEVLKKTYSNIIFIETLNECKTWKVSNVEK